MSSNIRRFPCPRAFLLAGALSATFCVPRPASAGGTLVRGILVHSSQEVTERYITSSPDGPVFHAPDGVDWPLLSRPSAPSAGDATAQFHPMSESEVEAAIRGINFPIDSYGFEVFILPFPQKNTAGSSASAGCLFLAPGVRDYLPEEVHFVVSHEMGHLVQGALMPDSDLRLWNRYRALRGIEDSSVYFAGAVHARRPHEIFAEDFRFLFGDASARYTGGIENTDLPLPTADPAVRALFTGLIPAPPPLAELHFTAGPNPSRGSVLLTFSLSTVSKAAPAASAAPALRPVRLEILGIDGRRVAQPLSATLPDGPYAVRFDGLDGSGRRLPAGTWYARLTVGDQTFVRKLTLLP